MDGPSDTQKDTQKASTEDRILKAWKKLGKEEEDNKASRLLLPC